MYQSRRNRWWAVGRGSPCTRKRSRQARPAPHVGAAHHDVAQAEVVAVHAAVVVNAALALRNHLPPVLVVPAQPAGGHSRRAQRGGQGDKESGLWGSGEGEESVWDRSVGQGRRLGPRGSGSFRAARRPASAVGGAALPVPPAPAPASTPDGRPCAGGLGVNWGGGATLTFIGGGLGGTCVCGGLAWLALDLSCRDSKQCVVQFAGGDEGQAGLSQSVARQPAYRRFGNGERSQWPTNLTSCTSRPLPAQIRPIGRGQGSRGPGHPSAPARRPPALSPSAFLHAAQLLTPH